jgi:hypothetical protein
MAANYRIYRIDGAGHVTGVEWVEAASDEDALAAARRIDEPGKLEVWLRDRLVGTVRIEAASDSSAAYWL